MEFRGPRRVCRSSFASVAVRVEQKSVVLGQRLSLDNNEPESEAAVAREVSGQGSCPVKPMLNTPEWQAKVQSHTAGLLVMGGCVAR